MTVASSVDDTGVVDAGEPDEDVPALPWPVRRVTSQLRRLRRRSLPWKVVNRVDRWAFRKWLAPQFADDPQLQLIRYGQHLRLVVRLPQLDAADVPRQNLDLVVNACEAAGVPYFLLRTAHGAPHRLGVPQSHREDLLRELRQDVGAGPVYLTHQVRKGRKLRYRTELAALAGPTSGRLRSPVWAVHRYLQDESSGVQFGVRHAAEIEFWAEDEDAALTAPRANRTTSRVSLHDRRAAQVTVGGRSYATLAPFAEPGFDEVTFPIDAVYTWVDGSDDRWLERKAEVMRSLGMDPSVLNRGAASSRFRDHDELRYSLRSLHQFAPWIRHVYLVTDRQVPEWLDPSSPGLTVVDHREIFGDCGRLPTFNSHAISARLHHIPNLAEHYLLINDDVFFGRPVDPSMFFLSNGTARFFLSKATIAAAPVGEEDPPHEAARKRAAALVAGQFGVTPTRAFKHTPVPQRRSVHLDLEERFEKEISATLEHQFRDVGDVAVASWLHHYVGYLTGRALPGSISYDYFRVTRREALARMSGLLKRRYADCFCLNDFDEQDVDDDERHRLLNEFLTTYFPTPSPFEWAGQQRRVLQPSPAFTDLMRRGDREQLEAGADFAEPVEAPTPEPLDAAVAERADGPAPD